jgi:hypothetical protein
MDDVPADSTDGQFDNNPYSADSATAPFAGRAQIFEIIHHHLTDPSVTAAATVTGRAGIGKTALLHHLDRMLESQIVAVYLPLRRVPLQTEDAWLHALSQAIHFTVTRRGFPLDTGPEPDDDISGRDWLTEHVLPDAGRAIRRTRRLALLLDDADCLIDAVEASRLPDDAMAYLQGLVSTGTAAVLTVNEAYEDRLDALRPLASASALHRLMNLSADDTADLLRQPMMGQRSVTDSAVNAVHRATGGVPRLIQRFGYQLYEGGVGPALTADDIKAAAQTVYSESTEEFLHTWDALGRDERLVLSALSDLFYEDAQRPIDTAAIESWMVETDYLMDTTAINAALRSLVYAEIVSGPGAEISINAGLLQKWLLDHARLTPGSQTLTAGRRRRVLLWLALIAAALLFTAAVLALATSSGPEAQTNPAPTATLLPQE